MTGTRSEKERMVWDGLLKERFRNIFSKSSFSSRETTWGKPVEELFWVFVDSRARWCIYKASNHSWFSNVNFFIWSVCHSLGCPCQVAGGAPNDSPQSPSWSSTICHCESWTSTSSSCPGDWIRTFDEFPGRRWIQHPFRNLTTKKGGLRLLSNNNNNNNNNANRLYSS